MGFRRAQTGLDYLLVLAGIIAIAASLLVISIRESEFSIALAAARLGAEGYLSSNSTLFVSSIPYVSSNSTVWFTPSVCSYSGAVSSGELAFLNSFMTIAVADSIQGALSGSKANGFCAKGIQVTYCVQIQSCS